MSKKVQKNFVMGLNIWWSWGLSIFCHFFIKKISFLRGWVVFLSKKRQFFSCKTSVFAGLGALFSNFFVDFLAFFLNVPAPPEGRAREAREANPRCWQPVHPSRWAPASFDLRCDASVRQPERAPASFTLRCRPPAPLVVGSEGRGYDSPKSIVKVSEWS